MVVQFDDIAETLSPTPTISRLDASTVRQRFESLPTVRSAFRLGSSHLISRAPPVRERPGAP